MRRLLVRLINDDNVDLYILAAVAILFTILGAAGISDVKTLSSVVLGLLAWLALSQIKSRRALDQLAGAQRSNPAALLRPEFPADLIARRAASFDILLIGLTMTRTVQGMRSDFPAILAAGGRVRILVMDPHDDVLMETADRRMAHNLGEGRIRQRILTTLDDMATLRERMDGRLEVRVLSSIPSAGFNCLDVTSPRGFVCVQHYEFQPTGEAGPIVTLEPKDGRWFQHYVAEAERMWEAAKVWSDQPATR
ncbi:hypothetical protein [Actinokineospora sp. HUAS TT18]|uniref:hypothetical protein n=1 Tax=Actinokineospora sp. HUAS TT18 TaxID=3447451 RepID=UPI003F5261C2